MKNKKLLKSSIECLKQLSVEMHEEMDNSKIQQLNIAIKNLESYHKNQTITAKDLLKIFGDVLVLIPAIANIIQLLSDKIK